MRFGGVAVESLTHYADLVVMYYSSVPQTKAVLLKFTEGFGDDNWFVEGGRKCAHMLMGSCFVTDQALPLPLIHLGGISCEFWINWASEIFVSDNVAYYESKTQCLKWLLGVIADPTFTIGLRSAVAQERSAYIPYPRVHAYPGALNGSQMNQLVIPIGQVSSIASIETIIYKESDLTTRSVWTSTPISLMQNSLICASKDAWLISPQTPPLNSMVANTQNSLYLAQFRKCVPDP